MRNRRIIFYSTLFFYLSRQKAGNQIDMGIDLGGDSRKMFSGNQKNDFSINLLLEMEKYLIKNHPEGIPAGWKIFDNIYPEGIMIGGEMIKLNQIGQELESK